MKREEVSYLVKKHMAEGMDYEEALEQVLTIENFEKTIKRYQKSVKYLEKELEKKDKLIKKLEEKINELKAKLKDQPHIKASNKKMGVDIFQEDIKKDLLDKNRHYLNRIQNFIEVNKEYSKSDIMRTCMINPKVFEVCIAYLISQKKVETFIGTRGLIKYRCVARDV